MLDPMILNAIGKDDMGKKRFNLGDILKPEARNNPNMFQNGPQDQM